MFEASLVITGERRLYAESAADRSRLVEEHLSRKQMVVLCPDEYHCFVKSGDAVVFSGDLCDCADVFLQNLEAGKPAVLHTPECVINNPIVLSLIPRFCKRISQLQTD